MKVYISATSRDLQKYRLAVVAALRRMGHTPIGMEDYVAEGMRPLNRCLEDVAACDVYVGIVAWRYGHVPKDAAAVPATLPAGTTLGSTSVTEFEFRSAVQDKKTVLMFLLDPEADWPTTQLDMMTPDGDGGKAVRAWRQEIEQQYLVSYFRTPEELANLVTAAVYRAEMGRQMLLESLRLESPQNESVIRDSMNNSGLSTIQNVIVQQQGAQALRINIGEGLDWWMTRLYFLSSLAGELTQIQALVFVSKQGYFVGIVSPVIVKERLASYYPMLKKYQDTLAQSGQIISDLQTEIQRRLNQWNTTMAEENGEQNVRIFVTKPELENWLYPYLITQAVDWDANTNVALQIQRILDWPFYLVPIVEKGLFSRVVDKQSLAEQVAKLFVREQVSRALSMSR